MTKITFLFFFISFSLFAQDFTFDKEKGQAVPNFLCQLKLMKGKVFKKTGTELTEVKVGERFSKADTIVTGEASIARVLVVDDTQLTIGPETEINFSDFQFVDKTDRKIIFNLIKGQLSGHVRNKAKDGDIQFRTKHTVLGVRGTEILMNYRTINNLDVSEYALLSGKAVITDEKEGKHPIEQGGHHVYIHDNVKAVGELKKLKLSSDEMKNLRAVNLDETKDFKPMLPYYKAQNVSMNDNTDYGSLEESMPEEKRNDKKHWKENLQKLNEKLKENSKKK